MASWGQGIYGSAWLSRSGLGGFRTQIVYPRIDSGARSSIGDVVWVPWWLSPWTFIQPTVLQQAQLIHTTWLAAGPFTRNWALTPHVATQSGPTVWNNWFFNTPFTPQTKLAFNAFGTSYSYVGGAAQIGGLKTFSIVGSGASYGYAGADGLSDIGFVGYTDPYSYVGGDFPNIFAPLNPIVGVYSYSGGAATFEIFSIPTNLPLPNWRGRVELSPKKQSERLLVPCDFASRLALGETITSANVIASVYSGADPNPAALLQGPPGVIGTVVVQTTSGGVLGTIYELLYNVNTSFNQEIGLAGYFVVEPDVP